MRGEEEYGRRWRMTQRARRLINRLQNLYDARLAAQKIDSVSEWQSTLMGSMIKWRS